MTFKQFREFVSKVGLYSVGQFMLCWGISDLILGSSITHDLQNNGCNFDELLQLQDKMNDTHLTNLKANQQSMVDLCYLAFEQVNQDIQGINSLRAGILSLGAIGYMTTLQVLNIIATNNLYNNHQQGLSKFNRFFSALSLVNSAAGAITSSLCYSVGTKWLYNEHIPCDTDQDLIKFAANKDDLTGGLLIASSTINAFLYGSFAAICCKQYCQPQTQDSPSNGGQASYHRMDEPVASQSSRFNYCQRLRSWCCSWFASDVPNNTAPDPESLGLRIG